MLNLSGLARQYLADTTQRSASFSRTCAPSRFQLQAWQKLTRPASLRWRRDVDSDSAVTHTNAHTNTNAQKCPGSTNTACPAPPLPWPTDPAYSEQLPRPLTKARDFHYLWLRCHGNSSRWAPGLGSPTSQLRFRQHFIILIFNPRVSRCAYPQHA